jgi:LacI family transcriptional regulator
VVATIRDVARLANVSISTTSRALNGRDDVSPDVRARVLAAARSLKYTANLHARALKGATARTIGVLLADTAAFSFNAPLLSGIYDAATPRGYAVIVCNASAGPSGEHAAHHMLIEKRVDGVLVNSIKEGPSPLHALDAAGIPLVLLNRRSDELDYDSVALDYRRGAYLAARHLLQRGHRRILHQLGSREHPPALDRLAGYRDALHELEVPFDPTLVVFCNTLVEAHGRVRAAFEAAAAPPTAVMAYNDEWALPALMAIHELGLRVPDDVAIVGHNNLGLAAYFDPPLTTVAHSVRDMARQATELLFEKIAWPARHAWTPRHVAYEPRLIVRASSLTGPTQHAILAGNVPDNVSS